MNKKSVADPLKDIERFIQLLYESLTEYKGDENSGLMLFSSEYGTLFLDHEETVAYKNNLGKLVDKFSNDLISPVEIERLLKKAILVSLDIKKTSDSPFDKRTKLAIQELNAGLKLSPKKYHLYYPVNNLTSKELPQLFGKITFVVFDEKIIEEYFNQVKDVFKDATKKKKDIFDYTNKLLAGKTCGMVTVLAIDPEAAKNLAMRELHITIDVINFFSDLLPGASNFLYLPGERERTVAPSLMLSDIPQQNSSIGSTVKGPIAPVSLSIINNKSKFSVSRAKKILTKPKGSFQERLLSAIQWAGRAATDARSEEAFLLYAISLESIMLSDNEKDELQYRLALRVAHLLGKDSESRKQIVRQVKDLYKVRSQIVHSGKFRVADVDLQQIKLLTKKCILRILGDETFLSMQTPKEFADWFEMKILE